MVIVPLYDKDPLERDTVPYVTYGLIAANVLIFLCELGLAPAVDDAFEQALGFLPARFAENPFGGGRI